MASLRFRTPEQFPPDGSPGGATNGTPVSYVSALWNIDFVIRKVWGAKNVDSALAHAYSRIWDPKLNRVHRWIKSPQAPTPDSHSHVLRNLTWPMTTI